MNTKNGIFEPRGYFLELKRREMGEGQVEYIPASGTFE